MMTTVFPHRGPGDPILGYQLPQVPSLPPQPVPLLPTALSVIQPSQETIYFQSPYVCSSGLLHPMFCEQPNVPPPLEITSMEGPINDSTGAVQETAPELTPNAVFYPPPPFPVPFPPQVHPFPFFNPYIRPSAILFVLPPFPDTLVPGNPLLSLPLASVCPKSSLPQSSPFASVPYQSWPTANSMSQNSAMSAGTSQSSLRFSGSDDSKNFQLDGIQLQNRSELMWRNKSGPLLDNFRNKLCINFKNGHCSYGDGCRFVHKQVPGNAIKTKFTTNAPSFVPRANTMHAKPNSQSGSLDMIPSSRLYSSTPVSLLAKGQCSGLDIKERPTTPTGRRVSYRQDFNAGYRRPSVADGPHPMSTC